jgi:cell division protein FtsI (penicillin-binding protein 3)/stage V sporulation protein D (sporulation-specific penicillin-binding protein)
MQEVLNKSVNTGVAFVVSKMGKENFAKYMIDFGLGNETGIDLPNEAGGRISNLKSPRDIEYATASFGQGIAITPINAVRALSAVANGGTLVHPHIAKKIDYKVGLSKNISYADSENKRVIKKETSEEITRMLVKVVDKALLEGTVKIPNYSVAAKTGTAQIAKPGGGGYYDDRYLHSFFGYFPAYNPRFLIFLLTLEPKGAAYASNTLTAPFMDTVKFLINYYEIPPDR